MRLLPLAVLAVLVSLVVAAPASAAFSFKAFHTPSGNITCVASGDRATGKDFALRCDIRSHTWRAPKQTRPCDAGDYGSSLGLTKRGRAQFICVSDAPPPSKRLAVREAVEVRAVLVPRPHQRAALPQRREARLVPVDGELQALLGARETRAKSAGLARTAPDLQRNACESASR